MKTILLSVVTVFFCSNAFSQTITWSSDFVKPAETETNSTLVFPGTDATSYYAVEYELGTRTIKKKFRSYEKNKTGSTIPEIGRVYFF